MTYTESQYAMSSDSCASKLLTSALAKEGIVSRREFFDWLAARTRAEECEIKRVPLVDLREWYFKEPTGTLAHRSGKFFTIEGISVQTNYGPTPHWMQPIINQPEIGILGFLTKEFDGTLHFLVQLKMEPGNINFVQLSPTLQATRSNYTQVHGGSRPLYLDYFLDKSRTRVVVDQLQPEQGSRFLHKFNRNMIVEVDPREPVEVHDDFCWLTLGQLIELTSIDNLVNMDTRTVLSCIEFAEAPPFSAPHALPPQTFDDPVLRSSLADERLAHTRLDDIYNWVEQLKRRFHLEVKRVPLNQVEGWVFDGEVIRHRTGRFFSVIGVSVMASAREVHQWDQPMVQSSKDGVIAFLCQNKNGVHHFLVQGMVEPGNVGVVKLGPTVQCTPSNYEDRPESLPRFLLEAVNAAPHQVLFTAIHSEEGGRFYHDQRRYLVVEVDENEELQLPENYMWMTLSQIKHLIHDYNCFNIEARALIACLGITR